VAELSYRLKGRFTSPQFACLFFRSPG